jgi:hypothetical protein
MVVGTLFMGAQHYVLQMALALPPTHNEQFLSLEVLVKIFSEYVLQTMTTIVTQLPSNCYIFYFLGE